MLLDQVRTFLLISHTNANQLSVSLRSLTPRSRWDCTQGVWLSLLYFPRSSRQRIFSSLSTGAIMRSISLLLFRAQSPSFGTARVSFALWFSDIHRCTLVSLWKWGPCWRSLDWAGIVGWVLQICHRGMVVEFRHDGCLSFRKL